MSDWLSEVLAEPERALLRSQVVRQLAVRLALEANYAPRSKDFWDFTREIERYIGEGKTP